MNTMLWLISHIKREFDTEELDKTIELFSGIYETALKGNSHLGKRGANRSSVYCTKLCYLD
jgi:hypothetical protein